MFLAWLPPDASVLMIKIPESAEVTKKVNSKVTMTTESATASSGDRIKLMVLNNCAEMSALTIEPCATPDSSRSMAVAPIKANHTKQINEGITIAPMTYSRMVRPRDTRAKNSPTKGAKAIHQAQ